MKNEKLATFQVVLFIILLLAQTAFSQTGVITGRIIDSYDKASLPGASVVVEELNKGASSDLDGKFIIQGVPLGEYTGYSYI